MRVFNKEKNIELQNYNLEEGWLRPDKLFIKHHEKIEEVKGRFHYEKIREYSSNGVLLREYKNGELINSYSDEPSVSADVEKIWDVIPISAKEAWDEYEDILVFVEYTNEEKCMILRKRRESECYSIINRGELWYKRLSEQEKKELDIWYQAWLDVTITMIVPSKPSWLK